MLLGATTGSGSDLNVNIGAGGSLSLSPGNNKLLIAKTLAIHASGKLDTADNDLVVNNGDFAELWGLVLSSYGMTTGITSSTSNGTQILAMFDNTPVGLTEWEGHAIAPTAIIGKYTYFGDANLDGQVTGDDYTIIDSNIDTDPVVGLEWALGDMNFDGIVTGDDYTIIDSNFGLGVGSPLAPAGSRPTSVTSGQPDDEDDSGILA